MLKDKNHFICGGFLREARLFFMLKDKNHFICGFCFVFTLYMKLTPKEPYCYTLNKLDESGKRDPLSTWAPKGQGRAG